KKNSYTIQASEKNLQIRELDVKRVYKNLHPGANLSIDKEILSTEDYKNGKFGPQKIEMPINLYSGGKRYNAYQKVKLDREIAGEQVNLAGQREEIRAIELYFQILNLQKQIEITNFTAQALKKQENRLNILFSNNKMVSKNELLEIRADIKGIEAELLRYENSIRLSKERLAQLMGAESEIDVTEYREDFREKNLQEDRDRLREVNSTIKTKELEVEKAKLDIKIAKGDFLPVIDLTPSYRIDEEIRYGKHDEWGVKLKASMNVFQWGATLDDLKSKKIAQETSELDYRDTLKTLEIDLNSKYREIKLLGEELKIAQERVEILGESNKIQNIRFTNGMISSLDYLESVQLLRRAEENRYALEKSLILANREYANLLK
ncbi:MAG: TolC family protein, partial [Fusobacteriaceae bacterium]